MNLLAIQNVEQVRNRRTCSNGRKVSFSENVIYAFRDGRIAEVWSVIDTAAIDAQ